MGHFAMAIWCRCNVDLISFFPCHVNGPIAQRDTDQLSWTVLPSGGKKVNHEKLICVQCELVISKVISFLGSVEVHSTFEICISKPVLDLYATKFGLGIEKGGSSLKL
jgi:hypothetical protein